jgi:RHS repeat-associated protein
MNSSEQSITFDDIGNRTTSAVDSVSSAYTVNNLNQYTSITGGAAASPTYDSDGNMTYDGSTWHHMYDAEDRLIGSSPNTVTNGSVMLEYSYNYKNLRVEKIKKQLSGREAGYPMDPTANPGTWNAIETRKYIWDGYNIAAEIIIDHVTPSTNISYYTWGLDLSGTLQGAGGVGGLLSDTKVSSSGTNTFYSVGDANGNVTEYVDANGVVKAHYEYSATGEETYKSGSMKDDFTHRFSTKPFDQETGFVQFQYRPYDAPKARFPSRDPIEERDAPGLYLFLRNDAINKWDKLGLFGGPATSAWADSVIDNHFASLKKKLKKQLKSKCPKSPTSWQDEKYNNDHCCKPKDCEKEAERMGDAYINAL